MKRYHVELGIPSALPLPSGIVTLWPTEHARTEAATDKYGPVELPDAIDTRQKKRVRLVEVTVDENERPVSVLYRVRYDTERDLCLAVALPDRTVKTVWVNLRTDVHQTLRRELYATA